MSGFGKFLRLAVRGTSHASNLSFELENFPRGLCVDTDHLAAFMKRRAPGQDALSTPRKETDAVDFVAGLAEGRTTGEPIVGRIASRDQRPHDYGAERTVPRPGHADFGQWITEGRIPTGGGSNSGRLTAPLCAAGALCLQWLARRGVSVRAEIVAIGGKTKDFERTILAAKKQSDSVGGLVRCTVEGLPAGLGGALFDGLESSLSGGIFAIPGVKGIEFGNGFAAAALKGAANNDAFELRDGVVTTATNRHGGILGGRTTGEPLVFTVAFKPTPTIFKPQPSVDLATMTSAECRMKGRHDPCIVRRAVPVVEAVAAFCVADALLVREAAFSRICLTLTGKTLEACFAQYASERLFTDLVELRLDLLTKAERARAAAFRAQVPVPVVFTFRRERDGGAFVGKESDRVACFRKLLTALAALPARETYVDFEEDFRVSELASLADCAEVRIVRSLHDFTGPVRNLARRLRALVKGTDEIAKIAFKPRTLGDVARLFEETRDLTDVPHVVCAMGPKGAASRVLAARSRSLWTYASVGGLAELGHLTPHELVRTYRIRTVTRDAALYGVTGWPLKATRSPEINNAAFAVEDEDAVMVPMPAETAREAFDFMRRMGMRGLAVTIPHKLKMMSLVDRIDRSGKLAGAINTVVRRGDGFVGYNTDVTGFSEALTAFAGDVRGQRVAVLGDGGAAQAVKRALRLLGANFRVFHRETPPAGYDLLVNATPVDPIPDYVFSGRELVYDLGYVPAETPLMARARAAGCRVENGFTMLVAQAREQRRHYRSAHRLLLQWDKNACQ